ncbi:uncharacterized protein CTRU02_210154 [Colletotrichum truncatum]|uniref:Uncharacterized protein n=1 Tax=Colletotrichum truncatum TaxID=5467 RepID=A0ACC3YUF7_COLTU|nr:uncharacterized protein CTRU02_15583 [Colletotrichum truncatum]KAF6780877.1 hypothetical protein CTRU02_15583 [Colletotrichum truncatum]
MMALFSPKLKFPIHMVQLVLVAAALGLSVARIFMPNRPRGRSGTMALGMAAKSLVIILYQVLTEHVSSFKRWASVKANLILNAMEVVFWAAVVYMGIQSQTQQACIGTSCTLGWVVVVFGILLSMIAGHTTIISWLDFRYFKANGVRRGAMSAPLPSRDEEGRSVEGVQIQEIQREGRKPQEYTQQQQQQVYAQQQAYGQQQVYDQQAYEQPTYPQQTYGQQYTHQSYGRQ